MMTPYVIDIAIITSFSLFKTFSSYIDKTGQLYLFNFKRILVSTTRVLITCLFLHLHRKQSNITLLTHLCPPLNNRVTFIL